MIPDPPHQDFDTVLDTVSDAAQHALNGYTATNTLSHPDLNIPDLPPPYRRSPGFGLEIWAAPAVPPCVGASVALSRSETEP
ncbi:MAG: hypothetical protein OXG40_04065 [Acidimicrobiaceae bacterium]|nr:hypothetical protein [Acidimicrobiaceae bacterium]MDE0516984.1 hypothetical protein [Acidimicrobiaceae bacterium]MDE0656578.1 hypothetical protein [Acidimicrobiaceae bacterium]